MSPRSSGTAIQKTNKPSSSTNPSQRASSDLSPKPAPKARKTNQPKKKSTSAWDKQVQAEKHNNNEVFKRLAEARSKIETLESDLRHEKDSKRIRELQSRSLPSFVDGLSSTKLKSNPEHDGRLHASTQDAPCPQVMNPLTNSSSHHSLPSLLQLQYEVELLKIKLTSMDVQNQLQKQIMLNNQSYHPQPICNGQPIQPTMYPAYLPYIPQPMVYTPSR